MNKNSTRTASFKRYAAAKQAEKVRALLLNDLFYLLLIGMGRSDMDCDFLYERCREVGAAPDGYLDLWAREHYKSTIITVGKTIQDVLKDPEITVGIFSHTRPIAKAFLKQIKREFETNQLLQEHFPHICPPGKGEKRTWSEDQGLIVQRAGNPKEATVEAWGLVDGQPTGKHFSLLIYDDVVTHESVSSPEMIAKVTEAWALSLNLGAHGGKRRVIGTRYHFNDTYKAMMERGSVIPRIYPATADGTFTGEPLFLERGVLEEKRRDMGPYVFGCQMLQNPRADTAMGFKPEWFRVCHEEIPFRRMNRYILVDPASEKKKGSDFSVFWVLGFSEDQNVYVIDGVKDRLNLKERADTLFRLHRSYQPLAVGYEKYGQQADIEHITDRQLREGYVFPIVPLGGQMPKNDRIRRLVPYFEQGRIFFPYRLITIDTEGRTHDLSAEFLNDEFLAFPVCKHDDMLDCLSRFCDPEFGVIFPKTKEFMERLPRGSRRAVQEAKLY